MKQYDFDGVVSKGHHPDVGDVIVSGRCWDECQVIYDYLEKHDLKGIPVFFNPMPYAKRGDHTIEARTASAMHKIKTFRALVAHNVISEILEDDPLQLKLIEEKLWPVISSVKTTLIHNPEGNY